MNPHIILEFANNHLGDEKIFYQMVDDYKNLKDSFKNFHFSIKLQYRNLDTFIHPTFKGTVHPGVKRFENTKVALSEWPDRIKYVLEAGFKIGCTPFDEISVRNVISDTSFSFLKIGSCSFTDWPMLDEIREASEKTSHQINIIASTGGSSLNEIDKVVSFLSKSENINLSLMHCIAKYPSSKKDQNLLWIRKLRERYNINIGLSTHENGEELYSGAFAACVGANIFEKHVVHESADNINKYSSKPSEMRKWLSNLEEALLYLGSNSQREGLFVFEKNYLDGFRRGAYSTDLINPKSLLNKNNVAFCFPLNEGQISANEWSKHSKIKTISKIPRNGKILKSHLSINLERNIIKQARDFVINLINKTNVLVPKHSRLEISHHYGIGNLDKFGLYMITIINLNYCKKLLFQKSEQEHPEQYHKVKSETFFIISGKINLVLDGIQKQYGPGDLVTIQPGVKHSWKALEDCVIEEISSNHDIKDSFYSDESINLSNERKSFISLFTD